VTTTEYALLLAPFAVLLIVAIVFLRSGLADNFLRSGHSTTLASNSIPAGCDPNYSGACVPPYPPDVDCSDLAKLGITHVMVTGTDVHHLDPDEDGIACD
jgi:Flp pilus assembly pilin Flp